MAGRRPKPTAMKILEGNPGHRPLNTREPTPSRGIPECPNWLNKKGQEAHLALALVLDAVGVLTKADGSALELLADALTEYRQARSVVLRRGATYECQTESGTMIRARPEVGIAADAWKRVRAMLIEFGLTPAARTKVAAAIEPPVSTATKDKSRFFNRGPSYLPKA